MLIEILSHGDHWLCCGSSVCAISSFCSLGPGIVWKQTRKDVIALANTHGGTMLVGIQEPHNIVGTQPEQIMQIIERAKGIFTPSEELRNDLREANSIKNKHILEDALA